MVEAAKKIQEKFNQISVKNFIFCCLFLIVLLFIFVYPAFQKISLLARQTRDLKNSALAQGKNESVREATGDYKQYEPKLALLNQAIIAKDRELEFITLLEEKAALRNLEQKININEAQGIEGANYFKIPILISLAGQFKDELDYLQDLEMISFYVNVKKITLSNSAENSATTTNMVLLADTFWR
ncbi:MAG: type 4a pilus biogenesis protein PilO [Patescibacteria group bacterium]|jgi:Tfp pilus assembly protein PilO